MLKLSLGLFLALGLAWGAPRIRDASSTDSASQAENSPRAALTASPQVEPAAPPMTRSNVLGSVLGQTPARDVGSKASRAAGGALIGADMVQMNMKMNMQFLALQNAMQMEVRYLGIHQNERCAQAALNFKLAGVGLDLDENAFLKLVVIAGLRKESHGTADGITVHTLNSFGRFNRFTASFLNDKMFEMTAEWSTEAVRLEDIRKKLEIQLGPDQSKTRVDKSIGKTSETDATPTVTVWDFTDVVVDRRFELSEDADSKTILLKVIAPSIPIDVGF